MRKSPPQTRSTRVPRARPRVVAGAAALVGMLSLLLPAVATAVNATHFENAGNALCLNSTVGGSVSMGDCNGANDWYMPRGPSGHNWNVIDRHTGLCLEASHITLGNVYTRTCGNSVYQQWQLLGPSLPGWSFYFNDGTFQCLVGGTMGRVYMYNCLVPNDLKQQWNYLPNN
jgi:hypothetical protein